MRSIIIGFATGVLLLQQQASLMRLFSLTLLLLASLFVIWFSWNRYSDGGRCAIRICSGVVLGWSWAGLIALHGLNHQLAPELEEKDLTIVGVITSLPAQVEFGQRFQFSVEQVLSDDIKTEQIPKKLILGKYDSNASLLNLPGVPMVALQPGERWQFNVRLRRPHGLANPHGFDYEVWLLEQGIGATGSVRVDKDDSVAQRYKNVRLNSFVFSFNNAVEWLRGRLRAKILAALPDQPYAPIIVALVIGDQDAISQKDWQVFSRTGVSHLIAISGLHISMVAGMAAALLFYLWRHSFFTRYALPISIPAQKIGALAGVLVGLLYVALSGFGIPAQRTLIMILVTAATLWLDRKTSVINILLLALALVLLIDPWAVLWPGFWLSFSAVGFIFYASQGRHDRSAVQRDLAMNIIPSTWIQRFIQRCRQASLTQYAITLGLVPLTVLLFNQISLVSPIANAIAIPVVSLLIMPLALLGSVLPDPIGGLILSLTHHALAYLFSILTWLSSLSWAVWRAPRPELWMFACALIGTFWCLAPKGWPMRRVGLIAWLPLIVNSSAYPKQGEFTVTALDIGQGMALLIETARHRMLYDTGPAYSPGSDAGSRVIYPYLSMRGISHLDGLMISHNDSDHSGGAVSLLKQVKFDWVSSSLNLDSAVVQIANQESLHNRCLAGQSWHWDGVEFEVLHPTPSIYESSKWKPNAKSCTIKISNGKDSILLAGDIEAVTEGELVYGIPDKLSATVLLAPHHGSGTSSTVEFLQAVKPKLAVFQFGYHNRYHHPKPQVWERYADLNIQRLRSDQSGAITLNFGGQLSFEEYRQNHARYWYPYDGTE